METTRRQPLRGGIGLPAVRPQRPGDPTTLEALDTPLAVPAPAQPLPAAPASAAAIPTLPLDFVRPADLVADEVTAAEVKAGLPVKDLLIRGFLSGAFLGIATSLALRCGRSPWPPSLRRSSSLLASCCWFCSGSSWPPATSHSFRWA